MLRKLVSAFFALGLILCPIAAQASRVSPMIIELKPSGQSSIGRVELSNDADQGVAYDVEMMRGEISPDGKLSLTPADDQFLVFPAQALVQGKSQQVFRVQYVGEPDLAKSQIYYMAIRQVPVAFTGQESKVQVVVDYNVLVNVVPDGAQATPVVRSIEPVEQDGKSALRVDVGNSGNGYFLAGLSKWTITGKTAAGADFEKTYKAGDDLSKVIGVGVVAPGGDRIFMIPTDEKLADGTTTISIEP